MTIDDFIAHPHARSCNLTEAHVVALRLYTTAAFQSINAPLRDLERFANKVPHPLPVTVALIRDNGMTTLNLHLLTSFTLCHVKIYFLWHTNIQ